MATYEELSASDRAIVDNTANLIRAGCGDVGKLFNRLRAIADDDNAIAIITSIDAGATIPNSSTLSGADDLTRSELVALFTELESMRSSHDTDGNRAAWSKAAGINALLG